MADFLELSKAVFNEVSNNRRKIHQNPELSFREYKTSEYIQSKLKEMDIPFKVMAETGVVGLIGSGDRCVALRADIDALPIQEETGLDFSSNNEGIMHACGHDMHTSMLLGAARILKDMENDLHGVVKLIFQPGEEKIPGGASILINEGVLEDPVPQAVFGQHVNPGEQVGKISVSPGPIMASADEIYFTVRGKSAHAAQPHMGNDAVIAASHLVLFLHSIASKFRNPFTPGVLSITAINGGNATNIFPEEVKLMGTLRSFDVEWREEVHEILYSKANDLCSLYNAECIVRVEKGYLPVVNNKDTTDLARATAQELLGKGCVLDFEPKMWAEDFAFYANKVPGTFWFLGVRPENMDEMPALHNSKFSPDEEAMMYGTALFAKTAHDFLKME